MIRNFKDRNGVEWVVWDVYPESRAQSRETDPGVFPHPELADGWLCFESGTEKRRLTPVPANWHQWDDDQLEALCHKAGYISRPGQRQSAALRRPDEVGDSSSSAETRRG